MTTKELVFPQNDFSGGLNNSVSAHQIADNEVSDCQNVDFVGSKGQIVKRFGYTRYIDTIVTTAQVGIFVYSSLTGRSEIIYNGLGSFYNQENTLLYSIPSAITLTTKFYNSAQYLDTLIMGDGRNPTIKYDGSTIAELGGSPPILSYFDVAYSRVFAAGNPDNPSRVYYTDVGTTETWGATSFFDVAKNDGDVITAIKFFRDKLLIFKTYSTWVADVSGATPTTDWSIDPLNKKLGCVAYRTIQQVENDLYLLTHNGVYPLSRIPDATATEFESACISNKVRGTLNLLNKSCWHIACAANYEDKYWLVIPTGSGGVSSNAWDVNRTILVYNYVYKNWTKYVLDIGSNTGEINQFLNYNNYLIFASYPDIYVFNKSYVDWSADAINSYVYTKAYDFNEPTKKRYTKSILSHEAVGTWNMTFKRDIDYQNQWNSSNVSMLGSAAVFGSAVFGTDKFAHEEQLRTCVFLAGTAGKNHGNYIQSYFQENTVGQNFKVSGIDTYFERYEQFGLTKAS